MSDSSTTFGRWLFNAPPGEEVVITGVSGRFPESHNVREFQTNLLTKKDMVTDDDRRWKLDHAEIPKRNAKIFDIDKIDAGFFGLHHRQANTMDPMMRKLLETSVEAIVDAGMNPSELANTKTGVFMGVSTSDMEIETLLGIKQRQSFGVTGYLRSFLAHRLSYHLRLKGPSFIADTACSSSLNAIESAFKAIRLGRCEYAIVGGVHLNIHPGIVRQFFKMGVLSRDGVARVFDEDANGYVKGETVACIFLQKAPQARRIYAQIVACKVNDDGYKSFGITFPSTEMQAKLLTEVFDEAGLDPNDIAYMEAHGTATEVGDPEEVRAIDRAIARKRSQPLLVGSVKCTIGHGEAASGLAGLVKVIIAMRSGYIPPNINLKRTKKGMEGFEEGRLVPVTETTKLEDDNAIIGVNNFGFGGNNCHLLVKRFNKTINGGSVEDDLPRLVCVSGRTEEAVLALLEDVQKFGQDPEYLSLVHQVFKMDVLGHMYRGYTIISEVNDLRVIELCPLIRPRLYVVFGEFGAGAKILGQLMLKFPLFRTTITKITDKLGKHSNGKTAFETFAIQIAVVDVLKTLGLVPTAVYGNSLGKLVCMYFHNMVTLEEAASLLEDQSGIDQFGKIEKIPRKPYLKKFSQFGNFSTMATQVENLSKKKAIILNFSDAPMAYELPLVQNGAFKLLETIGRLYVEGYNPQIWKLYPQVRFPVSRSTPMLAPSIKWNYQKSWYTFRFGGSSALSVAQEQQQIVTKYADKYLKGHIIDGRNLNPATKYLIMVWDTFLRSQKLVTNSKSVVFENCKFIRAVTLPENEILKLLVTVHKGSGYFEVCHNEWAVATGRIFIPDDVTKYQTDLPTVPLDEEDRTNILDQDDIYRELYLRGYNYTEFFRGITKCNIDGSAGLVRWENNWITFIDKLLQLKILEMDTRCLYVPVGIQKMVIDPHKHMAVADNCETSLFPAYSYKVNNIIKSGRVEISGIKVTPISRKKPLHRPILEKNIFVPHLAHLSLREAVRANAQIVLENSLASRFKAVEILDEFSTSDAELIMPLLRDALDDIPMVILDLILSSKTNQEEIQDVKIEDFVLTPTSSLLLVVATNILQRPNLLNSTLNSSTFILSREDINLVVNNSEIDILTEYQVGEEKLVLFRKPCPRTEPKFVNVASTNFEWLPELQDAMKSAKDVVIYNTSSNSEGLLGLTNCLRREPGGGKISCMFVMDEAPPFDPNDPFYATQILKKQAVNVYKAGRWGTYRHFPLEEFTEVENQHFFVNTLVRGDLSSLRWIQGPLHSNTKLETGKILVYPHYSSINFKDIMIASGRVSLESFTRNRLDQECLIGFEFAGVDSRGRRVAGMTSAALATIVAVEESFLWHVPDDCSLDDAATVVVVYATVLYSLFHAVMLKPGMSILIHSAAGGIGLAALNVCLYYQCEIFVTVGTEAKREYLKKNFPQIPESRIGNSRDTSFEEMIKKETKGCGVDLVLNSLSEEKLKASIRCVSLDGNFIEIGKYDLGLDSSFNLLLLERNVSYHGVMLDTIFTQTPEVKSWLMDTIAEGFHLGYVKALPRTVFGRDELELAFRHMTKGKHIGKVLIRVRNEAEINNFKGFPRFTCEPDKTYVIVGGLGGFGLELADWLYLRGAKKMLLVSRSGVSNGFQKRRKRFLQSAGVSVKISTADVTTKAGCIQLMEEATSLGSIDAIFNLAVVLKDTLFEDQTAEAFSAAFAPKARATAFLDQVTRDFCPDLRYFVVFSSVSCGRGNIGQTNYGMANSVMERICERRRSEGLPGLAIQWGAIGDVGLVAKMQKENKELVIGGTLQQRISNCLEVLDRLLKQDHPVVSSMIVAEKNAKKCGGAGSAVETVAFILGIKDLKAIDPNVTFPELGMDSIMGTELVQILEKDYDIFISPKDARNMTFAKLAEMETEKNSKIKTDSKPAINVDFLLQHIPKKEEEFVPITAVASWAERKEHVPKILLLPGLNGAFEPLKSLALNLKAHVFALQYKYQNPENSVPEFCKNILPAIEDFLSKGEPVYFVAYSFGAIVATELIALLEKNGYCCPLISIDGSPEYQAKMIKEVFPATTQDEFETLILFKLISLASPAAAAFLDKEKFMNCKNFEERFDLALTLFDDPKRENFDKTGSTTLYKRLKSIVDYKYQHAKLKSCVYLIKPTLPVVEFDSDDYKFSEICEKPVVTTILEGDHVTILEQSQLVANINKLIGNSSSNCQ